MGKQRRRTHRSHEQASRDSHSDQDWLYGRQPVCEVMRAGRRKVRRLLLAESNRPTPDMETIAAMAQDAGILCDRASREELTRLLGDVNHQGVAVAVGPYPYLDVRDLAACVESRKDALVLVLDHLEDPQNVGSLMRSADAAGVDAVIIPNRRACPVTSAVVRASAGATEHMRVAMVPNIVQTMLRLKDAGLWFVGLDAADDAKPMRSIDLNGPMGLVVGSEGNGMKRLTRETCDFLARLPMHGHVSSLNAGVAGAVALYLMLERREHDDNGRA